MVHLLREGATVVLVLWLRPPGHGLQTGRGEERALGSTDPCWPISPPPAPTHSLLTTMSLDAIGTKLILSFIPIYVSTPESPTWQGNPTSLYFIAHLALYISFHDPWLISLQCHKSSTVS